MADGSQAQGRHGQRKDGRPERPRGGFCRDVPKEVSMARGYLRGLCDGREDVRVKRTCLKFKRYMVQQSEINRY